MTAAMPGRRTRARYMRNASCMEEHQDDTIAQSECEMETSNRDPSISPESEGFSEAGLRKTVIDGGYCIGCAACTAVQGSPFEIEMDKRGQYRATLKGGEPRNARAERVCPFSSEAKNETQIGEILYGDQSAFDEHVGFHRACYVGYVTEGAFRAKGSSGGMGKWILCELLRKDLVDGVIQIIAQSPKSSGDSIYGFNIIDAPEDVLEGSKSVYYPVEMSGALDYIREHPGRYAITGIPCFIKALRLLAHEEPVFKKRIAYCIGLICGHLKSKHYADMIAWQFGVEPGKLEHIDFRRKLPGTRANEKGVKVESIDGNMEVAEPDIVQNLFGTNYNHGFFQYNACNFCDDVVGETADISVGDAWLDEYLENGKGTNVVVVRNPVIHRLVEDAIEEGRLDCEVVSADKVAESQAGGFRQRREGLAYRLHLADEKGTWRPPKRVRPSVSHISQKRRMVYDLRMRMTKKSHTAFQKALRKGDFEVFRREMQPLLEAYQELYRLTGWERIKKGVLRRTRWVRAWLKRKLSLESDRSGG